jgi:hypothetical protein
MTRVLQRSGQGLAAIAGMGLLLGCVSSYGGLTQETMAACINEAGIDGQYSVSSTLRGERMTFIVRPGPGVTQSQADVANACIARTIDGGPASAPAVASAPAMSKPAPVVGSQCVGRGNPLQGGVGYC